MSRPRRTSSCGPTASCPKERYTTARVRRARARAAVAARVADRVPRGGARRRPATSSSTRSATSRSSSCATDDRRARTRSTTRACTAARRLADGCGAFANGEIRCPYHALVATRSTAGSSTCPTATSSPACPTTSRSRPVRVDSGAGSCSSTSIPTPSRCSTSSTRCPTLLAPYRLDEMRFRDVPHARSSHANWKAVVDAFNEGYHVQGLHPQILPWTDDVEHRVRAVRAARALRPAARRAPRAAAEPAPRSRARRLRRGRDPRARSSPGSAARSSARSAPRSRSCARRDRRRARRCSSAYQERRMTAARRARLRRLGLHARPDDERRRRVLVPERRRADLSRGARSCSGCGPTVAIPTRSIKDTWVLEWPRPGSEWQMPRAAVLRRLARAQLGRDHRAGLHEPRQRAARACVHAASTAPASTPQAGEQRAAHAPRRRPLPDTLNAYGRGRGGARGRARRSGRAARRRRRRRAPVRELAVGPPPHRVVALPVLAAAARASTPSASRSTAAVR